MKSGIWIDNNKAWIMKLGEQEDFQIIESEVEDTRASGGYGGPVPYAAQVANPDDKIMKRKNHQLKRYFDEVINKVKESEAILIEGPAEAKIGLSKRISEINELKGINVETRSADKRTENQFKAAVREHFS